MKRCFAVVMDKKVKVGFRALMNSIFRNTPGFAEHIVCININLTPRDQNEIRGIYSDIEFVDVKYENYKKFPKHAPALNRAFYKLDLFNLAKDYNRILYVDTDIIFLDSIQPLIELPMSEELGLCYHRRHDDYNTGVMLIQNISQKPYEYLIGKLLSMKRAWLGDQTVIREAINDNIFSIHVLNNKWNTTKRQALDGRVKNYCGLHFVGKKPYAGGEGGRYKELEDLWREYVK